MKNLTVLCIIHVRQLSHFQCPQQLGLIPRTGSVLTEVEVRRVVKTRVIVLSLPCVSILTGATISWWSHHRLAHKISNEEQHYTVCQHIHGVSPAIENISFNLSFLFQYSRVSIPDRKLMFMRRDMKCTIFTAEKTHTHTYMSFHNLALSPSDPVTSGMTNHPQVGKSCDLIHIGKPALLTGPPQTLTTRMSHLIDQQSALAFDCVCVGVFEQPPSMQNNLWWHSATSKCDWYVTDVYLFIFNIGTRAERCLLSFLQKRTTSLPLLP